MEPLLDLPIDQFFGALDELGLDPERRADLLREYRRRNSAFSPVYGLLDSVADEDAAAGMQRADIVPISRPEGMSVFEAIRSGDWRLAVPQGALDAAGNVAGALDVPAAAAAGLIPREDMVSEALNAAGTVMGLGGLLARPAGSLGTGGRVAPRSGDETPAQQVARLLREDPSQVTDDMLNALTPNDNVELARLYQEGATGMPMLMDEASRMARAAQYWPGEAYHSTRADFPAFEQGDVGFHVGTEEQATRRLAGTRREQGMEGEAILPLRIRAENGLTAPDAGEWNDARFAADAMQRGGLQVQDIADEAADIAPQFEDADFWRWSDDNQGMLDDLRAEAEAQGYDHVRYANEVENAYGDLPGLTPEGQRLAQQLRQEQRQINSAVVGRRQPPPDDPSQIEAWINAPQPQPTAAEARRLDEIAAELERINSQMVNDQYSRAIFNPANIRSRFARFDPRLSHLANLNAANIDPLTGAAAMGASQQQQDPLASLRAYLAQNGLLSQ